MRRRQLSERDHWHEWRQQPVQWERRELYGDERLRTDMGSPVFAAEQNELVPYERLEGKK